jgi:hypothetical protein
MTGLRPALVGYLGLRRSLGFKLARDAKLLDRPRPGTSWTTTRAPA